MFKLMLSTSNVSFRLGEGFAASVKLLRKSGHVINIQLPSNSFRLPYWQARFSFARTSSSKARKRETMPSTSTSNRVPISRKIRKKLAKQREIEVEECKLSIYRRSCFQGAAIVRLSDLKSDTNFNRDTNNHPNIARLEQLFNYHGFLRLDEKYHIPVMIDTSEWGKRVKWQDPKSLAPEVPLPELEVALGCHLFVLDHEDVIAAAEKRFKELNVEDPWCVVDVYVTEAEEACE